MATQKKNTKKVMKKKLKNKSSSKKTSKATSKPNKNTFSNKKEIILSISLIIILGVGITLGLLFYHPQTTTQKAIARVNNEPIYQSEFLKFKENMINKGYPATDEMVLDQLISQKLLLQGAEKAGITVSEQDFDNFVALYFQQTGLTEESLKANLSAQNVSYDEFKKATINQLMILNYLNKTVRSKINITEPMIQQFYEQSGTNRTLEEVHDQIKSILDLQLLQQGINNLVEDLKSKANIQILNGTNSEFKDTNENLCIENGKPMVLLFTANNCKACEWVGSAFDSVVKNSDAISAHHWNLNTQDDLLTQTEEISIPKGQMKILRRVDKNMAIPAIIFGCKYVVIGTSYDSNQVKQEKELIQAGINKLLI